MSEKIFTEQHGPAFIVNFGPFVGGDWRAKIEGFDGEAYGYTPTEAMEKISQSYYKGAR